MLSCVRSSCFRLWSPPTPVNHGLFFPFSFFPFYTFPFLLVTGKHLVSARNPRRVSSPCSLLGSLASSWCYSQTPYSPALPRTQPAAPSHMQNRRTNLSLPIPPTFQFGQTQHLLHMEAVVFSLCLSVMDRLSVKLKKA